MLKGVLEALFSRHIGNPDPNFTAKLKSAQKPELAQRLAVRLSEVMEAGRDVEVSQSNSDEDCSGDSSNDCKSANVVSAQHGPWLQYATRASTHASRHCSGVMAVVKRPSGACLFIITNNVRYLGGRGGQQKYNGRYFFVIKRQAPGCTMTTSGCGLYLMLLPAPFLLYSPPDD